MHVPRIFQVLLKTEARFLTLCLMCFMCFYIYRHMSGKKLYSKFTGKSSQLREVNHFPKKAFEFPTGNMLYGYKHCFHLSWNLSKDGLADLVTKRCKRFVTIAKSKGRTGNDMFQIATIFGVAYRFDIIPIIPLTYPLLKYFDLPNVIDITKTKFENNINCRASAPGIYINFSRIFNSVSNFTMNGCFQSWRYFEEENDVIRKVLRLKSDHVNKVKDYVKIVNPRKRIQVCIHVRRRDFLSSRNIKLGFSVADKHFIERTKHYFIQKYSKVLFLVVTDDKRWCKANLKNVTVSPFVDPGDDMALMASCDHVVVTAGTFGWWGAWLSGGQTLYFNGYPRPKSFLDSKFIRYDYYPSKWIGLS